MRFDYEAEMSKTRYRGMHYVLISPNWEVTYKIIPEGEVVIPRLVNAGDTPHLPTEEVAKANVVLLVFQDTHHELMSTKIVKNKYNISVMREINDKW